MSLSAVFTREHFLETKWQYLFIVFSLAKKVTNKSATWNSEKQLSEANLKARSGAILNRFWIWRIFRADNLLGILPERVKNFKFYIKKFILQQTIYLFLEDIFGIRRILLSQRIPDACPDGFRILFLQQMQVLFLSLKLLQTIFKTSEPRKSHVSKPRKRSKSEKSNYFRNKTCLMRICYELWRRVEVNF